MITLIVDYATLSWYPVQPCACRKLSFLHEHGLDGLQDVVAAAVHEVLMHTPS